MLSQYHIEIILKFSTSCKVLQEKSKATNDIAVDFYVIVAAVYRQKNMAKYVFALS